MCTSSFLLAPTVDIVARVSLVDTNTDMRGTDFAITSLTPVTDVITQLLLTWLT